MCCSEESEPKTLLSQGDSSSSVLNVTFIDKVRAWPSWLTAGLRVMGSWIPKSKPL